MPDIKWKNLVGQERVKKVLSSALNKEAVAHAYLFCSEPGRGKFQAALEFASALLCDSPDNRPCYSCDSCRKLRNFAHPNFHLVTPVSLSKEHKKTSSELSDKGWEYLHETCLEKIRNPYSHSAISGTASIPVEWIREVNHAILRGSVSDRKNIIIITGIEKMRKESSNAMLKILEEPPSDTVIILLTDRLHSVLPTVVSRCQIIRFGYINKSEIKNALTRVSSSDINNENLDNISRLADGSYAKALNILKNPVDEVAREAETLWNLCLNDNWSDINESIDLFMKKNSSLKGNYERYEAIIIHMLYILRNCLINSIDSKNKIDFNIDDKLIQLLTDSPERVSSLITVCQQASEDIKSRGNILLIIINLIINAKEILNG